MDLFEKAQPVKTRLLGTCLDGVVILDTETDGLRPFLGNRPFVCGIASTDGTTKIVELAPGAVDAGLQEILENPRLAKCGHNLKFDVEMLGVAGYRIRGPLVDTMVLAQLADSRMRSYRLKDLAKSLLNMEPREETRLKEWMDQEKRRRRAAVFKDGKGYVEPTYKDVPRSILDPYLRDDLEYTARLLFMLWPAVQKKCPGVAETELGLLNVIVAMERRGVAIDRVYFKDTYEKATHQLAQVEAKLRKEAGPDFLWKSNKHLERELIQKSKLKCVKHTEKGAACFDADTLPLYDHPVARLVLEARKLHKMSETYYGALPDQADSRGIIHPSFRQNGAITGRMSCAEPNLQNIPRRDKSVRAGFVCRPGFVNLYLDYKQIEFKIFAHYSEEEKLIEPILKGEDAHKKTAGLLFGPSGLKIDALRSVAKTLNFAILFGAGARSLRRQIRKRLLEEARDEISKHKLLQDLVDINESGVRDLLRKYFKAYPGIDKLMKSVQRRIYREGRVVDVFGREYSVATEESYKALNYLVQGSAATVMKRGLIELHKETAKLRLEDTKAYLVNVVHDEFQIEVESPAMERQHKSIVARLVTAVEDLETFRMPITVDVAMSRTNWAAKKELKEVLHVTAA